MLRIQFISIGSMSALMQMPPFDCLLHFKDQHFSHLGNNHFNPCVIFSMYGDLEEIFQHLLFKMFL